MEKSLRSRGREVPGWVTRAQRLRTDVLVKIKGGERRP